MQLFFYIFTATKLYNYGTVVWLIALRLTLFQLIHLGFFTTTKIEPRQKAKDNKSKNKSINQNNFFFSLKKLMFILKEKNFLSILNYFANIT